MIADRLGGHVLNFEISTDERACVEYRSGIPSAGGDL